MFIPFVSISSTSEKVLGSVRLQTVKIDSYVSISSTSEEVLGGMGIFFGIFVMLFPLVQLPKKF